MTPVFLLVLLPPARTRPDAPRLDSDSPLRSSPAERNAFLKAKRSHRKADPDAAHRYTHTFTPTQRGIHSLKSIKSSHARLENK